MAYLACSLLVFSWLSVCTEVILRYFFSRPILWTIEITEYILLYTTFLGSAWLLRQGEHVRVDLLITRLKPKYNTILTITMFSLAAICCLILFYWGVAATLHAFHSQVLVPKELGTPKFLVLMIIPFGFLLLVIEFMRLAVKMSTNIHRQLTQK